MGIIEKIVKGQVKLSYDLMTWIDFWHLSFYSILVTDTKTEDAPSASSAAKISRFEAMLKEDG